MKFILSTLAMLCSFAAMAQPRQEITLRNGWKFSHDQQQWHDVVVPHDWAISGPFDKKWDLQNVAIVQNGETKKTEKSGRSGALPWIGQGFYECEFSVPKAYKHAVLHIDGAMSEAEVWINGKKAGYWPYGYNAFRVDATPFLNDHGTPNQLLIKLKNKEESSRWYPGGGIYRPITLILTNPIHLDRWETFIYTHQADSTKAAVMVETKVEGAKSHNKLSVLAQLVDEQGRIVAEKKQKLDKEGKVDIELAVSKPRLWSPETPYLYSLVTTLCDKGNILDRRVDKTGIRTISFTKEHGFQLNGQTRKFKGVCLHHDLGPLGAAVNKAALIRQVRILKDMGCDAIRTAHNMPSTMQMEVYDSLGMLVMAESFDTWIYPKVKNGYATFFKEWADKDILNLVKNHRNHPSLVMYSIGNEIPEQDSKEGPVITKHLQDICHENDPTRPVTQGIDQPDKAIKWGFAQVLDVPGFNYRLNKYDPCIGKLPQGLLLGSETASTVSSRGVYKFPVELAAMKRWPDGQCSSYDTEYCSWSNIPEGDFMAQDDKPYTIGQFVWTGFDYLGEPTPYDEYWPSRSSYFGICDLAGLPKDRFYLYRSIWNKNDHTIHLLPHWTFPGREGEVTPVYCYTDYPTAELFVNGKSQGKISKNKDSELDRYRLRWNDVVYEPGELKVVVYDENGKECGTEVVKTAGEPQQLRLKADRHHLKADGEDIAFVTVSMLDKDGNLCPDADDELFFEVNGNAHYKAACNGDATSLEVFTQPQMKLFHGKLVVLVQAGEKKGHACLTVKTKDGKISKMLPLIIE